MAKSRSNKTKKEQKTKSKKVNFNGINVKLQSNINKGEEAYFTIFQKLYGQDIIAKISNEKAMVLSTQFIQEQTINGRFYRILYGSITKFTTIDSDKWYNRKQRSTVDYSIPEEVYPNSVSSEYIFIPEAHRFFIKKSQHISLSAAIEFLEGALEQVIDKGENVKVHLMQSKDVIERIIQSDHIRYLDISVSYTNDDIGDKAQEFMDDLLKGGNIGSADFKLRPDATDELNPKNVMVRGLIEVAKDNGSVTAGIIENGKREKIETKDHPEVISVSQKDNDEKSMRMELLEKILKQYRDGKNNDN